MNIYFSSDFHLDHKNIIKYDNRPFKSVEEMNHVIISNTVNLLNKNDKFYFLGDFALTSNPNKMEGFFKSLAYTEAELFFIKGNHDKRDTIKLYERYGTYLGEQKKITVNNQDIVLNHYAMKVWDKSHHGAWHLYGHSHGSLLEDPNSLSFDIGCMNFNYEPLEFEEIEKIMKRKVFKPIDHHK